MTAINHVAPTGRDWSCGGTDWQGKIYILLWVNSSGYHCLHKVVCFLPWKRKQAIKKKKRYNAILRWGMLSFKAGERARTVRTAANTETTRCYICIWCDIFLPMLPICSLSANKMDIVVTNWSLLITGVCSALRVIWLHSDKTPKKWTSWGRKHVWLWGNLFWSGLSKRQAKQMAYCFRGKLKLFCAFPKKKKKKKGNHDIIQDFYEVSGLPDFQGPFQTFHIIVTNKKWMSMLPSEFLGHSCIPSSKLPDIMSPLIYRHSVTQSDSVSKQDLVGA